MKTFNKLAVLLILVVIAVSCSRVEASVDDVFYTVDDCIMGVWVTGQVPSEEGLIMTVKSPDKSKTWTVSAETATYKSVKYYGFTGFAIPKGNSFESGLWTVELACRDGQVATGSFQLP